MALHRTVAAKQSRRKLPCTKSAQWSSEKIMGLNSKCISIDVYSQFCGDADIAPNFHPAFVEYYFRALGRAPEIVGRFNSDDRMVAAFPVYWRQVFPSSVHKKIMGDGFCKLGDVGQPEMLFPVVSDAESVSLTYLSATTSPLLSRHVRHAGRWNLKQMAIAKKRRHKKLTHRKDAFLASGGEAWFTDVLDPKEFAEIYARLFCRRWNRKPVDLRYVQDQIRNLYPHVFGTVLFENREPVAAQLCYAAAGKSLFYVDFINSGVVVQKDNHISHGSIMMLCSLRRAEATASGMGRKLRYSFGYDFGAQSYKAVWTNPEPTFIGV